MPSNPFEKFIPEEPEKLEASHEQEESEIERKRDKFVKTFLGLVGNEEISAMVLGKRPWDEGYTVRNYGSDETFESTYKIARVSQEVDTIREVNEIFTLFGDEEGSYRDFIHFLPAFRKIERGVREEEYWDSAKKVFGGYKDVKKTREVPRKFFVPVKHSEIFEGGRDELAAIVSVVRRASAVDRGGRSYDYRYQFVLPISVAQELIGPGPELGGLLKECPDILERIIEKVMPEIAEELKNHSDTKFETERKAEVIIDPSFSSPTESEDVQRDYNDVRRDAERLIKNATTIHYSM